MKEHIQILYGLTPKNKNRTKKWAAAGLTLIILVLVSATHVAPVIINENVTDLVIEIPTGKEEFSVVVPLPPWAIPNGTYRINIINIGDETVTLERGIMMGDAGNITTPLSGELKGADISIEDYEYYTNFTHDEAVYMYYHDKRYREITDKMKDCKRRIELNYDRRILTSYNLSSEESAGKILKNKIIIYYEKNGEIKTSELAYDVKLEPRNRPSTPITSEEAKIYLGGPTKENNTTEKIIEKPPDQQPNYNNYIILAIILITILLTAFVIYYKKFKQPKT